MNIAVIERLGFSQNDNFISYHIGPFKINVEPSKNIITLKNPSNFIVDAEPILAVMISEFGVKRSDIHHISTQEIHIKYNLLILNNYLDHTLITI